MTSPALIDTGASISVISKDLARQLCTQEGRPYLLTKSDNDVTSATGHGLEICGLFETKVGGVGAISFYVVQNLSNHHCLIGWDALNRYGFKLNTDELQWGNSTFPLVPYSKPEVTQLDLRLNDLQTIIAKHKAIFGQPNQLKQANVPPMEIKTTADPIHQRPYRSPFVKRQAIDTEIDQLLELGIIRESSSPWASPVLLVPKKDGELRFCIDYRKLNDITVKNRYPLPFVQDIFDQLGGASVFSTLDMRSGYHQVPLTEDAIPKTAFVCHRGQYEFTRVPFGLCNAPSHYQAIMNKVLAKHIGKRVMVFLDDVVVYSKDEKQHAHDLDLVLSDIKAADLTLKESKCHFGGKELDLLGYVISGEGIRAQPSKTAAIRQLPPPTSITELRRFLGMCSYYRQLVPEFAKIAEPLHLLTRKNAKWLWATEQQEAFDDLKERLCSNNVMAHPNPQRGYILYTDACDYAIGGILVQEDDDGIERPIQYLSAQLTNTQRKWTTSEKECYAVVYCLDKLRCYLLGADLTCYTDHKPLLSLFTKQMKNTKIQRWGILFEEFGAKIKYRPGPNNVRADMLSRIITDEVAVIDMSSEWVDLETDQRHQFHLYDEIDKDLLIRDQKQEFSDEILRAHDPDSNYLLHDGILYSGSRTNKYEPRYPRIVLPSSFHRQVIERCHKEAGHASTVKTMILVQEGYVWPGMKAAVDTYIKRCPTCRVHVQRPEKPTMGDMPIAKSPGQIVGLDLIGPLIPSHRGHSYIMVLIDHFSGWVECYPLANKSNEEVWDKFRNEYLPRHGACRLLITDQGAEFKGKDWDEWLRGNRIEHRRSTPYHPQSNGRTERANRTIKEMIRKLVNGQRADWEDQLATVLWAVRTNTSMVTGYSPFFLHHARPARAPINDMLNTDDEYTFENRLALQSEIFQKVAHATEESRKYNQSRINAKANARTITVGDHVLLRANEPLSLTAKWDYGYVVTKVNGLTVDLLHPESGATMRVHREKVVLTDPDMPWEELNPRPRRQRQRVKQAYIRKRRDHVRRDSSVDSRASNTSKQSTNQRRKPHTAPHKPAAVFVKPTALPPFSHHRSSKRSRELDISDDSEEDTVAKRTRSHTQGEKRLAAESPASEPPAKKWRIEQVSLLQFVSSYFAKQALQN